MARNRHAGAVASCGLLGQSRPHLLDATISLFYPKAEVTFLTFDFRVPSKTGHRRPGRPCRCGARWATSVRSECRATGAAFPTESGLMRTVALIDQERTSKIILNGVSVARRKRLNPASVAT